MLFSHHNISRDKVSLSQIKTISSFKDYLYKLVASKGLTEKEFHSKMGYRKSTIESYCRSKKVSANFKIKLLNVLGASIEDLKLQMATDLRILVESVTMDIQFYFTKEDIENLTELLNICLIEKNKLLEEVFYMRRNLFMIPYLRDPDKKNETLNNLKKLYSDPFLPSSLRGLLASDIANLMYLKDLLRESIELISLEFNNKSNNYLSMYRLHQSYALINKNLNKKNYSISKQHFNFALNIARENSNSALEGRALRGLALVYKVDGDYSTALRFYEDSLSCFDFKGEKARTYNNIADLYKCLNNFDKALLFSKQSLSLIDYVSNNIKQIFISTYLEITLMSNFTPDDLTKAIKNFFDFLLKSLGKFLKESSFLEGVSNILKLIEQNELLLTDNKLTLINFMLEELTNSLLMYDNVSGNMEKILGKLFLFKMKLIKKG